MLFFSLFSKVWVTGQQGDTTCVLSEQAGSVSATKASLHTYTEHTNAAAHQHHRDTQQHVTVKKNPHYFEEGAGTQTTKSPGRRHSLQPHWNAIQASKINAIEFTRIWFKKKKIRTRKEIVKEKPKKNHEFIFYCAIPATTWLIFKPFWHCH